MYIVPRQTENFPDTQRTGKREIHADVQVCIPTGIQRFANRFRVPNLAFPAFGFAEVCLIEGVLRDDIPAHGLIKGASCELEHLFHLRIADVVLLYSMVLFRSGTSSMQVVNEDVHGFNGDALHGQIPDQRVDVISDDAGAAVVHGRTPL